MGATARGARAPTATCKKPASPSRPSGQNAHPSGSTGSSQLRSVAGLARQGFGRSFDHSVAIESSEPMGKTDFFDEAYRDAPARGRLAVSAARPEYPVPGEVRAPGADLSRGTPAGMGNEVSKIGQVRRAGRLHGRGIRGYEPSRRRNWGVWQALARKLLVNQELVIAGSCAMRGRQSHLCADAVRIWAAYPTVRCATALWSHR